MERLVLVSLLWLMIKYKKTEIGKKKEQAEKKM